MIGKLQGIIDSVYDDFCILLCGGVGYRVFISHATRDVLPPIGETCTLHIETIVREDMIRLYGFATDDERTWYRLLTSVQGVGAKVAMAILSTLSLNALSTALMTQNKTIISKANGVGPKVAERICIELKNKIPTLSVGSFTPNSSVVNVKTTSQASSTLMDALSALINLGYSPNDAQVAVMNAVTEAGETTDVQTLIRLSLKGMGR